MQSYSRGYVGILPCHLSHGCIVRIGGWIGDWGLESGEGTDWVSIWASFISRVILAGDTDNIWCVVCGSYIAPRSCVVTGLDSTDQAIPFPNHTYVGRIST